MRAAATGCSPSSRRVMSPMRAAPAVWEDEGPTMMGPMMSKMFMTISFGERNRGHSGMAPRMGAALPRRGPLSSRRKGTERRAKEGDFDFPLFGISP